VITAGGTLRSQQLYKPWGETRYTSATSLPTKYQYTGQYSYAPDPSASSGQAFGLHFYNARWYDSSLGRFAQADSIVPVQSQGVQAWDRYAYANNNAIRYNDQSGHWIETAWDIASVVLDIVDIAQNGLTWENGAALAVDVASVIIPAVPAVGSVALKAARAANAVDNALGAAKAVEGVSEAAQAANKLVEVGLKADEAPDLIRTIVDASTHNPDASTVVLGSYPQYIDEANFMKGFTEGFSYFSMPGDVWNTLKVAGSDFIWSINLRWSRVFRHRNWDLSLHFPF
jgi:RHS repeat-associated protein